MITTQYQTCDHTNYQQLFWGLDTTDDVECSRPLGFTNHKWWINMYIYIYKYNRDASRATEGTKILQQNFNVGQWFHLQPWKGASKVTIRVYQPGIPRFIIVTPRIAQRPEQEPAPVLPTVHYNMGGIPTNWKTQAGCESLALQERDGKGWSFVPSEWLKLNGHFLTVLTFLQSDLIWRSTMWKGRLKSADVSSIWRFPKS